MADPLQQEQRQEQHQSLLQRLTVTLLDVLFRRDFEFVELLSGGVLAFWGVWLLNPWAAAFNGAPAYALMANLLPEWFWGTGYVLIGGWQIVTVLVAGPVMRQSACMAGTAAFAVIVVMVALASNFTATGVPTYGLLCVGTGWACIRLERLKPHGPR